MSRQSMALSVGADKMPGHPKLAEAAVRLAEGQAEAARSLHQDWQALAAEPSVTDHIRVGNLWALEQLGLVRKALEPSIGLRARVSEVLSGRRRLTLDMIRRLHRQLGIPAEVLLAS